MTAMKRSLNIVLVVTILSMLAACSSITRAVLPDHRVVAHIKTTPSLNPNDRGRPSPLSVYLFQLKKTEAFNGAEFFDLYEKGKETLGDDYVAVSKINLMPDTNSRLTLSLKPDVQYIGIVAGYHNMQSTTWRTVIPLDSSWGREKFRLLFDKQGVRLDSVLKTGVDINIDKPNLKKEDLEGMLNKKDEYMNFEVIKDGK
jgi:type VI secretion system protein VasD